MNASVALVLAQDGSTNGAIYALLSLALVLVFAVTRGIFIFTGKSANRSITSNHYTSSSRMKTNRSIKSLLIALSLIGSGAAMADINIGVTISATGSAVVLGSPQKTTTKLFPISIAGEKMNLIVLDEASDPTNTVKNFSKLISENKADLLIGGSITPATTAMTAAPASCGRWRTGGPSRSFPSKRPLASKNVA